MRVGKTAKTVAAETGTKPLFSGSVVQYCILPPSQSHSLNRSVTLDQVQQSVKKGLNVSQITELQAALDIPLDRLTAFIGIPQSTFHRKKKAHSRLGLNESDRIVRYARLLGMAIDVLETMENARAWLNSPQVGLGGAIPLDYATTELGVREVENLLLRIDAGVYS